MKRKQTDLLKVRDLTKQKKRKESFYSEGIDFVREQFEKIMKKNLKIPVNIIQL